MEPTIAPLHSYARTLPADYFRPPSTPERPVLRVLAFYGGRSFPFARAFHGAMWEAAQLEITLQIEDSE